MTHLSKRDSLSRSIVECLQKHLETASRALESATVSDARVHQARKALQKSRACMRLLRPGLKKKAYRLENITLRDAARPLGAARDAKVLLDTVDMLIERYGEPARVLELAGLRRLLREKQVDTRRLILNAEGSALAHSRRLLRECRKRVADYTVDGHDDRALLGEGFKHVYAKGRRALAQARREQSAAAFHEWRKEGKYLRYQLEMLEPLRPGLIGELADQAHTLADYLGQAHDLSVLRVTVRTHLKSLRGESSLYTLIALIDRCQDELREKATLLGSRLYQERSCVFAGRFDRYWRAWRKDAA